MIAGVVLSTTKRYHGYMALEIGAGSGALLHAFAQKSTKNTIVGIDLEPRNPAVQQGDCTDLTYKDQYFDTIFCTDVIEHLNDEDLLTAIKEANRVLKVGGHAIYTTINDEVLKNSLVTCPDCHSEFHRWGHCQVFTADRVRQLYETAGFKVVKILKTNLGFRTMFGSLASVFYLLRLHKLLKLKFLTSDLLFVVRKTNNL
jgi:ubiquinone/menaquinone biosynthesis C-methylase UbiE